MKIQTIDKLVCSVDETIPNRTIVKATTLKYLNKF